MRIIVTGSCGFIGTHVVNKLLTLGHEVVGVDCFDPQVHGKNPGCDGVDRGYRYYGGYAKHILSLGADAEVLIHLGARVGVGQSMHQISDYVWQNSHDTAEMLSRLSNHKPKRLVVASSMSIYGEGACEYRRALETNEEMGFPLPTPESKPPDLRSIYALTKYDQEQLCLIWGKAYDVPTVALRFFNTYGPGQSMNNPYTGVLAIFASRLLNDKPPVIYEDGQQTRDFIHVDDVANAVVHAATGDMPSGAYNVGTGVATSILKVAEEMACHLDYGTHIAPTITGEHRKGDIRHCFADITKIRNQGWEPKIPFTEGLMEYCAWLKTQPKPDDKFDQAHSELVAHGLTK